MGKRASLTEVQRGQIVILQKQGLTERDISQKIGCSKTAVHQAIVKFKNLGTFRDLKRSGRPRKTTPRDDHVIRRIAVRSPTSSCRKIRGELLSKGVSIHISTISRRLVKEFNLKSHKPARKPRLTAAMKIKRLQFAKKHEAWNEEQWAKVFFSDESAIQQFGVRKVNVRRPSGKRFDERYIKQTVKHPPSIMVWGGMSSKGNTGLFFLPPKSTMNGQKYLELLQAKLKFHMQVHNCEIFMQDGAPCHRCKIVTDFLKRNKIKKLDWPGNSPDLNPIENLWMILKDKVAEKQPTSLENLKSAIREVWTKEITPEYCQHLVSSMPRRIKAVIAKKGGNTKY